MFLLLDAEFWKQISRERENNTKKKQSYFSMCQTIFPTFFFSEIASPPQKCTVLLIKHTTPWVADWRDSESVKVDSYLHHFWVKNWWKIWNLWREELAEYIYSVTPDGLLRDSLLLRHRQEIRRNPWGRKTWADLVKFNPSLRRNSFLTSH